MKYSKIHVNIVVMHDIGGKKMIKMIIHKMHSLHRYVGGSKIIPAFLDSSSAADPEMTITTIGETLVR